MNKNKRVQGFFLIETIACLFIFLLMVSFFIEEEKIVQIQKIKQEKLIDQTEKLNEG
jgi:hypothetical protein